MPLTTYRDYRIYIRLAAVKRARATQAVTLGIQPFGAGQICQKTLISALFGSFHGSDALVGDRVVHQPSGVPLIRIWVGC